MSAANYTAMQDLSGLNVGDTVKVVRAANIRSLVDAVKQVESES